jgi:hypothetical protein
MATEVTLVFESDKAKQQFMTGMCDGWGESFGIELEWQGSFAEATRFMVSAPVEEEDDPIDNDLRELLEEP